MGKCSLLRSEADCCSALSTVPQHDDLDDFPSPFNKDVDGLDHQFHTFLFLSLHPLCSSSLVQMVLPPRSLLALCLASSPVLAATAGSFADGGNTLISAMMVFICSIFSPILIAPSSLCGLRRCSLEMTRKFIYWIRLRVMPLRLMVTQLGVLCGKFSSLFQYAYNVLTVFCQGTSTPISQLSWT